LTESKQKPIVGNVCLPRGRFREAFRGGRDLGEILKEERTRLRSWPLLAVLTALGGGLVYAFGGFLVEITGHRSPGFVRMLLAGYAALATGFLFSALVTRVAPRRRYTVAVGLVFVMVLVAAALMLRHHPQAGPLPAALLGTSLVVGAFGYALRVRGFSESVSGREP